MAGPVSARVALLLLLGLTLEQVALAKEIRPLYRSARAQAMGGAYVALADDEAAVFLNPAGLAGGIDPRFHYLPFDIDASIDTYSALTQSSSLLGNFSVDTLNALMGKNIYGRTQITPTLILPKFAVGLIVDGQIAYYSKNVALPQMTLGYQVTNGVQVATGFSFKGKSRRRRDKAGGDLRVGIAAKYLFRRGGYRELPTTTLLNLSSGASLLNQVAGGWGSGYGVDLGVQYILPISDHVTAYFGSAMTDIANTTFTGEADPIEDNLAAGAAVRFKAGVNEITLAYQANALTAREIEWKQRNHFGLEWKLPMLSIYGGIHQVFFTYGVGFDAWIFRVTALSYAQELGTYVRQDPNRRYMLKFDLKFAL